MIKKISITGGIGSGKSTVLKILSKLGYCVWDADMFAAEAVKNIAVEAKIKKLLGEKSYLSQGMLNKEWVRDQIFSNQELKNSFEAIVHPQIKEIFTNRLQIMASNNISCWIFYEASLIFEKKLHSFFDANILVVANDKKRMQRLYKNKKIPTNVIANIMAQQMSTNEKKEFADYIINNSDSSKALERKVLRLVQYLKKKFKS